MVFFRPFNVSLISSFCHWEITAVPIDCRDDGLVETSAQSFSAAAFKEAQKYLCHVSDLFLNVLVGGSLLLHLVPQGRQRLVQGIGFPLGLGGCQTQRYEQSASGEKSARRREREAEREERKKDKK